MAHPKRIAAVSLALALMVSGAPAFAQPIVWEFEGTVRAISYAGQLPSGVDVSDPALSQLGIVDGASFSATVTIDPATPSLSSPSDPAASYPGAILAMSFTAGAYRASIGPSPATSGLSIDNTLPVEIVGSAAQDGASPDLFSNPSLSFALVLPGYGQLASVAIPAAPPLVSALEPYSPSLIGVTQGSEFDVSGHGTSSDLTIHCGITRSVAAPEPPLLMLLAAGLGAVLRRSASRSR